MNVKNLIESLKGYRKAIGDDGIGGMDFDQLEKDLEEAARALGSPDATEKLCQRLLSDFKSEIQKMALAVSRAKGEGGSCGLVEKLLSSPDLSFDDLLFLREKTREEFNQCFPVSPQSQVMVNLAESKSKVTDFKAGVKM
jgi:hypothetical protein